MNSTPLAQTIAEIAREKLKAANDRQIVFASQRACLKCEKSFGEVLQQMSPANENENRGGENLDNNNNCDMPSVFRKIEEVRGELITLRRKLDNYLSKKMVMVVIISEKKRDDGEKVLFINKLLRVRCEMLIGWGND